MALADDAVEAGEGLGTGDASAAAGQRLLAQRKWGGHVASATTAAGPGTEICRGLLVRQPASMVADMPTIFKVCTFCSITLKCV